MNVLVTGSRGFIGTNLMFHLKELSFNVKTLPDPIQKDLKHISSTDFVIHLAAENRPKNHKDFDIVNFQLTKSICEILRSYKKNTNNFYFITQAEFDNPMVRANRCRKNIRGIRVRNWLSSFYIPFARGLWEVM